MMILATTMLPGILSHKEVPVQQSNVEPMHGQENVLTRRLWEQLQEGTSGGRRSIGATFLSGGGE